MFDLNKSGPTRVAQLFLAFAAACAIYIAPSLAEPGDRKFSYGITGSSHPIETENPSYYFSRPEIQALIVDMIPGPVPISEIEDRMRHVDGVTEDDLFRTGLIRKEGGRAYIGFALNTESDILSIRETIQKPLQAMTAMYFEQSAELSRILDDYPADTVAKGKLAFVILGAFSLDWDGLYLTAEKGYRARPPRGRGHFFRADEQTENATMRAIYKGSHNLPAGLYQFSIPFDSTFTSFGDHYRRGRAAFPDIFWQPRAWYSEAERPLVEALSIFSDEESSYGGFISEQTAAQIAEVLYALREAPADIQSIGKIVNLETGRLASVLVLLEELEYIDKISDGTYVLLVPVLDYDDRAMVDATLALSWRIMESWLAEYYDEIKAGLSDTTAMRHGIPYEEYFSNVWHHIFGLQNREMTRSGLFSHPYGLDKKYKGFYPALWRSKLYDFCSKNVFPCKQ